MTNKKGDGEKSNDDYFFNLPQEDRRLFLKKSIAFAGLTLAPASLLRAATGQELPAGDAEKVKLTLHVNGKKRRLTVDPRMTTLDLLREKLGLTGTKKGCDFGQCGACTIHVDGQRGLSCLSLAVMQHGKKITTIEGLGKESQLHPMQEAFIKHDGFQCGYCTPGQIMSAVACIRDGQAGSEAEIQEYMSGNLCRCGAYPNIVNAIVEVKNGNQKSVNDVTDSEMSLDRVDGRVKVDGTAKYSAEYAFENLAHAVLVTSTIAKGTILSIDAKDAEATPGVLTVISHLNSPGAPGYGEAKQPAERASMGTAFRVFFDNLIYFNGQPVAMVVAETWEQANYAASLVKIEYKIERHQTNFEENIQHAAIAQGVQKNKNSPFQDYTRGNPAAFDDAKVKIEATYTIPTQHHQPMEPHAIVAVWEGADRLTVYDKNQGVKSAQGNLAQAFKLPRENVKVNAQFIGGAFGSGIRVWPHTVAAVLAAKKLNRPVKLILGRDLMFTSVGYRPYTIQKVAIGADENGLLSAISHEGIGQTSAYEEHLERTILASRAMYACPNMSTKYKLLSLDVNTPTWMRGPGDATGMFALESALDELAYAMKIDPLEMRLRNYAESDPERNLPWSAKGLRECYELGAEKFGWKNRTFETRSMQKDNMLIGYGMASSLYGFHRHPSKARAIMLANGSVIVQSATMDIGPGTGTAMTRIAAKVLGVSPKKIRFDLGDSSLPDAPGQNGSSTIPSVGSAVHVACEALKKKLSDLAARMPGGSGSKNITYPDILKYHNLPQVEVTEESKSGPERDQYSMYSFGCHFVEVHVNSVTGEVRVKRVVTCADVGKIINFKTARSQSIGGVVGGIGMALMEASVMDHRYGRYITRDFANYHIPVHKDIPQIDVVYVDKPDMLVNPIGSKGLGEIAIVGVAAAVANAVFHATGKRVRELPITVEKLI
ncbi:molybdopterin-dependent oxidoreductase [Dyadobacter psychrophilus]|uniref:Xanthine dehydrogenase YagR molybdenum-binding subunit n=1 Tax=Dyadobacter psychrophilus TaxID=651661 RepID=A0A1T5BVN8_9BACT|nr:molybdopterin-dependent oxidoreductase [Dyadobacter psychrophilus]SKB51227.1 xanthine dehydrogenase YagR molybdenum-binding subunit [Dyadobacter psychrophilus]